MSLDSIARLGGNLETQNIEAAASDSLRVLHIDNIIGETCCSYNEHVLPKADDYELSVGSFYPSPIDVPPSVNLYAGNGTVLSFFRSLMSCFKERDYDIIHIHAPHAGIFTLIFLLFFKIGYLKSTVYTVHNSYQNYSWFNRFLVLIPFAFFRRIIHCSWSSFHSFPRIYGILGGSRRTAVPNGVDVHRVDKILQDFQGQADEGDNDDLKILSIGRLIPVKNPFTLMNSVARAGIPKVSLQYLGEGHLRESLSSSISQSDLSGKVFLRGIIPRDEVYHELVKADLFISTSLGEGLPIAVMEAMCCGCPVILSDIPPHRELANDVSFIPLIDPMDTQGFSREIEIFQAMSQEERSKIGQQCRKLVEDKFSLDAMHEGYASWYRAIQSDPVN